MHAVLIGVDRQRGSVSIPVWRSEGKHLRRGGQLHGHEARSTPRSSAVRVCRDREDDLGFSIRVKLDNHWPRELESRRILVGIGPGDRSPLPIKGAVPPSTFHAHIAPLEASMVVNTTWTFDASMRTAVGSEGCVPRSSATSQSGAPGVAPLSGSPTRWGRRWLRSITASTRSGAPSRSTSAKSGCVTALCPLCEEGSEGTVH